MFRRRIGLILALTTTLLALVASLPIILGQFFTLLSGKLYCWAEKEHIYQASQTLWGVQLDDLRCLRCTKLISGEDKVKAADQILKMNLEVEDYNRHVAAERIIEETKRDSSQGV